MEYFSNSLNFKTNFSSILGDVNGDQVVNILDVIVIVQIVIGEQEENENADLNQDNSIDIIDIVQLVQYIINN